MDFLRPALLWGLLAVSLPILIHLLGRRRVRTVPIATLRFLERARARAAARLKLRRILLLLSRMAALGCLAALYAGPGCRTGGAGVGPATWVLLLDNSPSMAAARGGESRLEAAKEVLLDVLRDGGPEDRFLFATTLEGDPAWRGGFVADRALARAAISTTGVAFGRHSADRALESGLVLLEGVEGGRLVFATDLQASGWGGEVQREAGVAVEIADVGFPDPANRWVDGVDEGEDGIRVHLGAAAVGGWVGAGSGGERTTVRLDLSDGRTFTAFVEGEGTSFQARLPPGLYTGQVGLDPGGDLALDDHVSFAAHGRSQTRVLLVNGDPRGFEIRDELLFVRRALGREGVLGRRFESREVRLGDLVPSDLEGFDVVLLANPGPLDPALAEALRRRLEAGAGLVVTAGDRWDPEADAAALERVLAAPLRDRVVVPPDDPSRLPFERLAPRSFGGPVELFQEPASGDLTETRVRTYWVLAAGADESLAVWMRLQNGAPLLVERRLGEGRTLLLTTTVDRDGADLCLQPAFIPWLERLLLHAADRLRPPLERWAVAGEPFALPYDHGVVLEGERGERARWEPGMPPFVPPSPGLYRVLSGKDLLGAFAARLDPAESDLTRLAPGRLAEVLGGQAADGGGGVSSGRVDRSEAFAGGVVLALLLEALLSGRWGARRPAEVLNHEELGLR